MAQFHGSIRGQRGDATRLGSKSSGLAVHAASWQGMVRVYLWHDTETGKDMATVALAPHWQVGGGVGHCLYNGPIDGWKDTPQAFYRKGPNRV